MWATLPSTLRQMATSNKKEVLIWKPRGSGSPASSPKSTLARNEPFVKAATVPVVIASKIPAPINSEGFNQ